MYKFEKSLVEGSIYSICGFVLVDNTGDYRTTRHHYNVFPYTFLSPADILSPTNDSNYLVGMSYICYTFICLMLLFDRVFNIMQMSLAFLLVLVLRGIL